MNFERLKRGISYLLNIPYSQFSLYYLNSIAQQWRLPHHIGIILDGNRRYARENHLPSIIEGHALGAEKLFQVLDWSFDLGIRIVTIWIFSLDNFKRDEDEVKKLLNLIEKETRRFITHEKIHNRRIKVRYLGRLELLPESLRAAIGEIENATSSYDSFYLNVAIAYGGREEIVDAFTGFLQDKNNSGKSIDDILVNGDLENFSSFLYTKSMPDPDLIIRTSGELRLSGFLLWQSAYSEFYFCDTFWPAFRKLDLMRALHSYDLRQRRFGR